MIRKALLLLGLIMAGTSAKAAPSSITEITVKDQLGYACIAPEHLEEGADGEAALAFRLAGKLRMPRTCLPDPCARVISQQELSALTGTPVSSPRFQGEWDDYYARYADHCVSEVVPFGHKPYPRRLVQPRIFWTPLIQAPITTDDIITRLPEPIYRYDNPLLGQTPRIGPIMPPLMPGPIVTRLTPAPGTQSCQTAFRGQNYWLISDDGTNCRAGGGTAAGAGTGFAVPPSTVPLPMPAWMLLSAIAAFGLIGRRR